jgi:hypothetical protein
MTDNPTPATPDLSGDAAPLLRLHDALTRLTHLADAWAASAERAHHDTDDGVADHASYHRGITAGLGIAARHLTEHLPRLLAAIPPCPHGTTHDHPHCPRWCW